MIYEIRQYEVEPGRMNDLHERFRKTTLGLFAKHGMKLVAAFTSDIGEYNNILTYILAFESHAQREIAWSSFLSDTQWINAYEESNSKGNIVVRWHSQIGLPTDYSPICRLERAPRHASERGTP